MSAEGFSEMINQVDHWRKTVLEPAFPGAGLLAGYGCIVENSKPVLKLYIQVSPQTPQEIRSRIDQFIAQNPIVEMREDGHRRKLHLSVQETGVRFLRLNGDGNGQKIR